jgi:hypothetical protein
MKADAAALARTRIFIGIALAMGAGSAAAVEFAFGDGWKGNWNTTISAAQTWRAQSQDPTLYSLADGLVRGFSNGRGGSNTDSGNLNYDRNDTVSQVAKLLSDVSVEKNGTGALIRFKAWYDNALENNNVPFGNQGQRPPYTPGNPLDVSGLTTEQRFTGFKLLDAYAYTQFNVSETPVQLRLGNQVINWGESLFLQGINVTSPIDLPALRRGAGTEIKEFLLPVPVAYANIGLPKGMSLEMFYQFQWQPTVVDACGTFFSPAENAVSYQIGNCNIATTFGGTPTGGNNAANIAAGRYFALTSGVKGSNSGNYGVAFRFPVNAIDTEFGTYYQHLSSRTPIISVRTGTPLPAASPILFKFGGAADAQSGFWEYPNDIQVFGLSAGTNIAGWSIGSELSYWKDVPGQINGNDLLAGFLQGIGPVGPNAKYLAGRSGAPAAPVGTVFHGYDLFHKTQFQVNAVQLFSNVLWASNLTVVGEYGAQWNNVPDYQDGGRRYGRAFIFGLGTSPTIAGGANLCAVPQALGGNPQPQGCQNNGYITSFADGFRLRGTLTYNDVFMGVAVIPSLFWGHDLHGTSIDGQFNAGKDTVAVGVKFDFNKKYTLDLGYVTFGNSGTYDNFRDRDFYSAAVSVTF